jgi:transcription elongation factor Elf1
MLNAHFGTDIAAMTDRWNETLRCPKCGKTGVATVYQGTTDDSPSIEQVPDGFKVVRTQYGPNFHCAACGVAVDP